ncbi:MAG: hypothetical protein WC205_04240 [Opitutaceae bacterium]|jgi:hypothetical protein
MADGNSAAAAAQDKELEQDDGLAGLILGKPAKGGKEAGDIDNDDEADPEHDGDEEGDDADADKDDPDAEDLDADEDEDDADKKDDDEGDGDDDDADADEVDDEADPDAKLDDEGKAVRDKFTPKQQAAFDREIGKKVKVLATVRAELADTKAELEEARKAPPARVAPTAENPLADIESEADLDKRIGEAKAWRNWLRVHPEGGTIGEGDKAQVIEPEQAKSWLIFYEDLLTDHVPARRELLKQRDAAEVEAVKVHPWLKTKAHPGTVEIEAKLRAHPQLRAVPGIRAILADAYVTRTARKTAAAAAAAGKGGKDKGDKKKVPINPGGGGQRPAKMVKGKPATKAHKRLEDTGEDPGDMALHTAIFGGKED